MDLDKPVDRIDDWLQIAKIVVDIRVPRWVALYFEVNLPKGTTI
jgi:hypothetical protein